MFAEASAFIAGFYLILSWSTFSLMLLGMAIGFIVGILPGLGGPATMALMLPFIFDMSPAEAFAFLLGAAAVTATTGDITSILLGVPGEPISASIILDGYPMAKKGEAGRALGAALMSSLVGAIIGGLCLMLAVPIVRPLVLAFGSPEFFMMGLVGITFVASLSGGNILKGFIAAGLGFFLAMVGLDPVGGSPRYTLGQVFLLDGIGLVPVTVGLFGIPELVDLAIAGGSIAREKVGKIGGVMQGIKDTFVHFWLVIRCSALGACIALLPGMGASLGQWMAYAHAVQSSPGKERFGKGAVEGVLGPGAANNSNLGGALIPTIGFGVPGNVLVAMLFGAFLIQGIVPGPDMLIPPPKGKLDLTFSFVWIIVISNLITVAISLLFIKQLSKITNIRGNLVIPFILFLVYLGAFAEKNAFGDMIVMLIFGLLGYLMVKLDWQRPPLILGLVLGPLMERRFFLSTDNYGIAWLSRPGVLILAALTLFGIFYPVLKERFRKKAETSAVMGIPTVVPGATEEKGAIRFWDIFFTLFIVVALGLALWESKDMGYRAGLFPRAIGFPVLIFSIFVLGLGIAGKTKISDQESGPHAALPRHVVFRRTAEIIFCVLGFFLLIWLLGFSYAVPLATLLYLKIAGREKWLITIIMSVASWAFFYGLFDYVLHIPFPEGQLFIWLR